MSPSSIRNWIVRKRAVRTLRRLDAEGALREADAALANHDDLARVTNLLGIQSALTAQLDRPGAEGATSAAGESTVLVWAAVTDLLDLQLADAARLEPYLGTRADLQTLRADLRAQRAERRLSAHDERQVRAIRARLVGRGVVP